MIFLPEHFDLDLTYYISGPMTGYPNYNYGRFDEVQTLLDDAGVKTESPHTNTWPLGHEQMSVEELHAAMMKKCFDQMDRCHGIILIEGWLASTGAWMELTEARRRAWPVYFYTDLAVINMNRLK